MKDNIIVLSLRHGRIVKAFVSALLFASTVAVCAHAQAQAFAWYPGSTLAPGRGIEINNPALRKGFAIQYSSLVPHDSQAASSSSLSFDASEILDTRALETFTTLDFDLDANHVLFDGGTNVPWLNNYNFPGPVFVWGLRGYSDFGRYDLQNATLTPDAQSAANNPARFESEFGDAYVNQIRKAAIIVVIFSIDDTSTNTIAQLKKLIGSGLTYSTSGGQVSGNFDGFLAQAMSLGLVHFQIQTQGGPPVPAQSGTIRSAADISSMDGLLNQYSNGITESNAMPVVYYTAPYTAFGVTLPPPPTSTVQQQLEKLAFRYYDAAQGKLKLENVMENWNDQYAYLDRSLHEVYRSDLNQLTGYLDSITAIAPRIRDTPGTQLPDPIAINVPWPSPSITVSYHLVTVQGAAGAGPAPTGPGAPMSPNGPMGPSGPMGMNGPPTGANGSQYTVIDAKIHGAIIKQVVILKGSTVSTTLTQTAEDYRYLMAHEGDNNFLYNGQINGSQTNPQDNSKNDAYVMRWVLSTGAAGLVGATAVAIDANGNAIATCDITHADDNNLSAPPANGLSE